MSPLQKCQNASQPPSVLNFRTHTGNINYMMPQEWYGVIPCSICLLTYYVLSLFMQDICYSVWILVCQTLDNGLNIVQLETAVGAGIKSFEGAVGMLDSLYSVL